MSLNPRPNENTGPTFYYKNPENIEKLPPAVQDIKIKQRNNMENFRLSSFDPENMHQFIKFNTKNDQNYRLQHYLYLGENLNGLGNPKHYMKFSLLGSSPPYQTHYPRFDQRKYVEETES